MLAALSGLMTNLRAGARLALFARVQRQDFRVDAAQLLLAFVVSALVDVGADWVRQPQPDVLEWSALGAELASFAVLVAIATLLAWAFSDVALIVALPIVVLVSLPLVQIANLAPHLLEGRETLPRWLPETVYYLVLAWFLAVLWRSAFVVLQPGPRRLFRSIATAFLLSIPPFLPAGVLPEAPWWKQAEVASSFDTQNPASEPVLALQRELQDEALAALEDHTPGESDLYFVAFAPDGAGATWRPHVERAKKVMDDHWGTQRRSLAYVNDVAMLTESPMATVTHLREALEEIAGASNPDEDIVMLYLAGRNNPDGSLHASLPPLGLVQLTGAGLAHLFRQAGIRWRVIIIATCVTDAFVEALADDRTLILAAAGRGERAAGCTKGEAPAAFGDALFAQALASATSLPVAFESTQRTLAERGPVPYLHVGDAIAPQLSRLRSPSGGRATARTPVNG